MKPRSLLLGLLLTSAPALAQPMHLTYDQPTPVNGVTSVCTGVGSGARENPRWSNYPLKVEAVGRDGQYLADERVAIHQGGQELASVTCGGPWVLFKLQPGDYRVTTTINGVRDQSKVYVRAASQRQIIMRFPDQGGAVSPQHEESLTTGD